MRPNTVAHEVLRFINSNPGLTDGQINTQLYGGHKNHAHINITCRQLAETGRIHRRDRPDGKIGNYPRTTNEPEPEPKQELRTDIAERIGRFMEDSKAPCHRYLSWDYCFAFFKQRSLIRDTDTAALHLAWFLASWGMLRGSSRLLQRNHKVLTPVVDAILDPRLDHLLAFDPERQPKEELLEGIFADNGLRSAIVKGFTKLEPGFPTSDTLITKVILGTLACAPAYDVNVTAGLKRCGLTASFGPRSVGQAYDLYSENIQAFTQAGRQTPNYPPFKLVDMYLFDLGAKLSAIR